MGSHTCKRQLLERKQQKQRKPLRNMWQHLASQSNDVMLMMASLQHTKKRQQLAFCGFNACFQNGVAEKQIRDLSKLACTMLIHANRRWPSAINHHLWPCALQHADKVIDNSPCCKSEEGRTPTQLQLVRSMSITGFLLDVRCANSTALCRTQRRSTSGLSDRKSACSLDSLHTLVLDLHTGLGSPQFHMQCDTKFQTVRCSFGDKQPESRWQECFHFDLDKDTGTQPIKDDAELASREVEPTPEDELPLRDIPMPPQQKAPRNDDNEECLCDSDQLDESSVPEGAPLLNPAEGVLDPNL